MATRSLEAPALLCLLAVACGGTADAAREPESQDLEAEVAAFLDAYQAALVARDTAALRSQLAGPDRYVWAEEGVVRYRSADEVLESLAALPPDTPLTTELSDLRVAPVGTDGAHASALFETTLGEGAGAFSFNGVITWVLERAGGTWRVVGGHASSGSGPGG